MDFDFGTSMAYVTSLRLGVDIAVELDDSFTSLSTAGTKSAVDTGDFFFLLSFCYGKFSLCSHVIVQGIIASHTRAERQLQQLAISPPPRRYF